MYTIRPIRCGTLTSFKNAQTYRIDHDTEVTFPVLSFLVLPTDPDDETVILVDTGVKSADSAYMREHGRTVGPPGGGPEPLVDGLAAHGVAPADVDTVVLTHLHHDHSSNNDLFENAEFFVQSTELSAARSPPPIFADAYPRDNVDALERMDLTAIDGEHAVRPGLDLVPTPGHTIGSQSVVVETAGGPHVLMADLAYSRHNLEPGLTAIRDADGDVIETTSVDADFLPPGLFEDLRACYESVEILRERVGSEGVFLPGHDAELADRYPIDAAE